MFKFTQKTKEDTAILLSNRSERQIDTDYFSHKSIVQTLYELVLSEEPPLTIGLFSSWGTGKTVIVNDLKKKLATEVKCEILDLWNVKPEEFREFFLEELNRKLRLDIKPKDLLYKRIDFKSDSLIEKLSKIGVIALFVVAYFALPFLIPLLLDSFKVEIPSSMRDILRSLYYATPIVLIWQDIIRGNILFSNNFEHLAIKSRREYLFQFKKEILGKPKLKNKKLVVVLDNLDRVDAAVVLEVLSEIRTFLETDKIIYIIPADYNFLVSYLNKSSKQNCQTGLGYISKVFDVCINVQGINSEESDKFIKEHLQKSKILSFSSGNKEIEMALLTKMITTVSKGNPRKVIEIINKVIVNLYIAKNAENGSVLYDFISNNISFLTKIVILDTYVPNFMQEVRKDRDLFSRIINLMSGRSSLSEYNNSTGELSVRGSKIEDIYKKLKEEAKLMDFNIENFLSDSLAVEDQVLGPFIYLKDSSGTRVFGAEFFEIESKIFQGDIDELKKYLKKKDKISDILTSIDTILKESLSNQQDTEGVYCAVSHLWSQLAEKEKKHSVFSSFIKGLSSRNEAYYGRINLENTMQILENENHRTISTEASISSIVQRIIKLGFNGTIDSNDFFEALKKYGESEILKSFGESITSNLTEVLTSLYTPAPINEDSITAGNYVKEIESEYVKFVQESPHIASKWIPSISANLATYIGENYTDTNFNFIEKWRLIKFIVMHEELESRLFAYNVILPGLERDVIMQKPEFTVELLTSIEDFKNILTLEDNSTIFKRILEIITSKSVEFKEDIVDTLCRKYVLCLDCIDISVSTSFGDYFSKIPIEQLDYATSLLKENLTKYPDHREAFVSRVKSTASIVIDDFVRVGSTSPESDSAIKLLSCLTDITDELILYNDLIVSIQSKDYNKAYLITKHYFEKVHYKDFGVLQGAINNISKEDLSQGSAADLLLTLLVRGKGGLRNTALRIILEHIENPQYITKLNNYKQVLTKDQKRKITKRILINLTKDLSDYKEKTSLLTWLESNLDLVSKKDFSSWLNIRIESGSNLFPEVIPLIAKIIVKGRGSLKSDQYVVFVLLSLIRASASDVNCKIATMKEALGLYENLDKRMKGSIELKRFFISTKESLERDESQGSLDESKQLEKAFFDTIAKEKF